MVCDTHEGTLIEGGSVVEISVVVLAVDSGESSESRISVDFEQRQAFSHSPVAIFAFVHRALRTCVDVESRRHCEVVVE
jgi:hypothetical protein